MDITTGSIVAAIGGAFGLIGFIVALTSGGKRNAPARTPANPTASAVASTSDGLAVAREELLHELFKFKIRFAPQTSLTVEFSQLHKVPNPNHPGGFQETSGVLIIDKGTDETFRMRLVLSLFDMISRDDEDGDIAYLEGLGANGLSFETKHDGYITQAELFLEPEYVDEEGWCFKFERPLQKAYDQYDPVPTSTSKILADILTGQMLKFSVCARTRSSREQWESSRFSGITSHLVTIEFPYLDILRDRFAKTFGIEVIQNFAQQKGLKLKM